MPTNSSCESVYPNYQQAEGHYCKGQGPTALDPTASCKMYLNGLESLDVLENLDGLMHHIPMHDGSAPPPQEAVQLNYATHSLAT